MDRIKSVVVTLLFISHTNGKEMTEIEALASGPTRCIYEYAYDMYGANCAGLRLTKIPKLKGGIEILDFSDNKLDVLNADILSSYSSIKYLYLAENKIYQIDDNAFASFTSLQILDLSNNVFFDLPSSIFHLPSLRNLYLSGNPLIHMNLTPLKIIKPITAPLELLDVSNCKLKELPDWGALPLLKFYNISHNPLTSLDTKHFAVMCNLNKVDITKSIDIIQDICSIKPTVLWFQEKQISFLLDDYTTLNSKEFDKCHLPEDNSIQGYNITYHKCKADYSAVLRSRSTKKTWLTIGGGLFGFLIGFIILLYVMHRYNVAQTKSNAEKMKQAMPPDADKNASINLLKNMS